MSPTSSVHQDFDWVVVACGHFSMPHLPELPGAGSFPGRILHSHDFRIPSEFAGQRLLLVGSGSVSKRPPV
jgi:trimethylamine monooxygenase